MRITSASVLILTISFLSWAFPVKAAFSGSGHSTRLSVDLPPALGPQEQARQIKSEIDTLLTAMSDIQMFETPPGIHPDSSQCPYAQPKSVSPLVCNNGPPICASRPYGCAAAIMSPITGKIICTKCLPGLQPIPFSAGNPDEKVGLESCKRCDGNKVWGPSLINNAQGSSMSCICPPGKEWELGKVCLPCPPNRRLSGSSCLPCSQGFHLVNDLCVPCEDPFVVVTHDQSDSSSCVCSDFGFPTPDRSQCLPCPPYRFKNPANGECERCGEGYSIRSSIVGTSGLVEIECLPCSVDNPRFEIVNGVCMKQMDQSSCSSESDPNSNLWIEYSTSSISKKFCACSGILDAKLECVKAPVKCAPPFEEGVSGCKCPSSGNWIQGHENNGDGGVLCTCGNHQHVQYNPSTKQMECECDMNYFPNPSSKTTDCFLCSEMQTSGIPLTYDHVSGTCVPCAGLHYYINEDKKCVHCVYPKLVTEDPTTHKKSCQCPANYLVNEQGNCVYCDPFEKEIVKDKANVLICRCKAYLYQANNICVPCPSSMFLIYRPGKPPECKECKPNPKYEPRLAMFEGKCIRCPVDKHIVTVTRQQGGEQYTSYECVDCPAEDNFYVEPSRRECVKCGPNFLMYKGDCICPVPKVLVEGDCTTCGGKELAAQTLLNCKGGALGTHTEKCVKPFYMDSQYNECRYPCFATFASAFGVKSIYSNSEKAKIQRCLSQTSPVLASGNRFVFYDPSCTNSRLPRNGCLLESSHGSGELARSVDGCRQCQMYRKVQADSGHDSPFENILCPTNYDQCWVSQQAQNMCNEAVRKFSIQNFSFCKANNILRYPLDGCAPECVSCETAPKDLIGACEELFFEHKMVDGKCAYACAICQHGKSQKFGIHNLCLKRLDPNEFVKGGRFEKHQTCKKIFYPVSETLSGNSESDLYGLPDASRECLLNHSSPEQGIYGVLDIKGTTQQSFGYEGNGLCKKCQVDIGILSSKPGKSNMMCSENKNFALVENCYATYRSGVPSLLKNSGPSSTSKWYFSLWNGLYYEGNDLESKLTENPDKCRDDCAVDSNCLAFSFDLVAGICYLKKGADKPVRAGSVQSSSKYFIISGLSIVDNLNDVLKRKDASIVLENLGTENYMAVSKCASMTLKKAETNPAATLDHLGFFFLYGEQQAADGSPVPSLPSFTCFSFVLKGVTMEELIQKETESGDVFVSNPSVMFLGGFKKQFFSDSISSPSLMYEVTQATFKKNLNKNGAWDDILKWLPNNCQFGLYEEPLLSRSYSKVVSESDVKFNCLIDCIDIPDCVALSVKKTEDKSSPLSSIADAKGQGYTCTFFSGLKSTMFMKCGTGASTANVVSDTALMCRLLDINAKITASKSNYGIIGMRKTSNSIKSAFQCCSLCKTRDKCVLYMFDSKNHACTFLALSKSNGEWLPKDFETQKSNYYFGEYRRDFKNPIQHDTLLSKTGTREAYNAIYSDIVQTKVSASKEKPYSATVTNQADKYAYVLRSDFARVRHLVSSQRVSATLSSPLPTNSEWTNLLCPSGIVNNIGEEEWTINVIPYFVKLTDSSLLIMSGLAETSTGTQSINSPIFEGSFMGVVFPKDYSIVTKNASELSLEVMWKSRTPLSDAIGKEESPKRSVTAYFVQGAPYITMEYTNVDLIVRYSNCRFKDDADRLSNSLQYICIYFNSFGVKIVQYWVLYLEINVSTFVPPEGSQKYAIVPNYTGVVRIATYWGPSLTNDVKYEYLGKGLSLKTLNAYYKVFPTYGTVAFVKHPNTGDSDFYNAKDDFAEYMFETKVVNSPSKNQPSLSSPPDSHSDFVLLFLRMPHHITVSVGGQKGTTSLKNSVGDSLFEVSVFGKLTATVIKKHKANTPFKCLLLISQQPIETQLKRYIASSYDDPPSQVSGDISSVDEENEKYYPSPDDTPDYAGLFSVDELGKSKFFRNLSPISKQSIPLMLKQLLEDIKTDVVETYDVGCNIKPSFSATTYNIGQRLFRSTHLLYLLAFVGLPVSNTLNIDWSKSDTEYGAKVSKLLHCVSLNLNNFVNNPNLKYDDEWGGIVMTNYLPSYRVSDNGLYNYEGYHYQMGYYMHALGLLLFFINYCIKRNLQGMVDNTVKTLVTGKAASSGSTDLDILVPTFWSRVFSIIRSYADPFQNDHRIKLKFPFARNKDMFRFFSLADGLRSTRDGRSQDSIGESINAYLGAARVGLSLQLLLKRWLDQAPVKPSWMTFVPNQALGLGKDIRIHSQRLLVMEQTAAKYYWQSHYPSIEPYEPGNTAPGDDIWTKAFRIVHPLAGVVWTNRIESYVFGGKSSALSASSHFLPFALPTTYSGYLNKKQEQNWMFRYLDNLCHRILSLNTGKTKTFDKQSFAAIARGQFALVSPIAFVFLPETANSNFGPYPNFPEYLNTFFPANYRNCTKAFEPLLDCSKTPDGTCTMNEDTNTQPPVKYNTDEWKKRKELYNEDIETLAAIWFAMMFSV